eukprot:85126-Pleurochrysis_carterae.AAC.2
MAPVVLFSRSGGGDGGGGGALHSLVGKSNSGRAASVVTVEEAEDDAEDDVEASFQRPAFAVDGEPQDEDAPPCDGLEYLRRVRKEASSLPQIVRKTAVHYDVMKGGDELKQVAMSLDRFVKACHPAGPNRDEIPLLDLLACFPTCPDLWTPAALQKNAGRGAGSADDGKATGHAAPVLLASLFFWSLASMRSPVELFERTVGLLSP